MLLAARNESSESLRPLCEAVRVSTFYYNVNADLEARYDVIMIPKLTAISSHMSRK